MFKALRNIFFDDDDGEVQKPPEKPKTAKKGKFAAKKRRIAQKTTTKREIFPQVLSVSNQLQKNNKEELRSTCVLIIAGERGSGKTTYTRNHIMMPAIERKSRVLVLSVNDHHHYHDMQALPPEKLAAWCKDNSFTDPAFCYYEDANLLVKRVVKNMNCVGMPPALIILEDATMFVGTRLSDDLRTLILASKQKNIDLVLQFHSLSQCTLELFKMINGVVMFKTKENMRANKNRMSPEQFELCNQYYEELKKFPINAYESRYFSCN